jgi:hypothetical protein
VSLAGHANEPTAEMENVRDNALLRIAATGTGNLDPNRPYAAEALIRDVEVADELGIKLGETDGE